jgi:hypothetical protein
MQPYQARHRLSVLASGESRRRASRESPHAVDREDREVMNAGDVSGVRTSSQETWLSTRLSDPNAALWASITPPADPTLKTIVRRRAAAFSLDLLAQRLHLRFPETFSSRSRARFGILGAAMAFGVGVGLIGYLTRQPSDTDWTSGHEQAVLAESTALPLSGAPPLVQRSGAASTSPVRLGETVGELTPMRAAASQPVTEQVTASLTPRSLFVEPSADTAAAGKAKAKRSASAKKKPKTSVRRATKFRRARIASE